MTSSFEVDYDLNPTTLYTSITNSNWDAASRACRLYPEEARTWVVRRERDEDGNLLLMDANDDADDGSENNSDNVLWRFLPLHSALARSPPAHFIKSLLKAYPQGLRERDASSMLPLHYACGNRASKDVIQLLLDESSSGGGYGYAAGVWEEDSNGMTALHYLGSWGQCQDGIVEMILRAAEDTKRGGGGGKKLWFPSFILLIIHPTFQNISNSLPILPYITIFIVETTYLPCNTWFNSTYLFQVCFYLRWCIHTI